MITAQDDSPSGLRNKILLLMGYETMRRRAELVGFEFDDLTCLLNGKTSIETAVFKGRSIWRGTPYRDITRIIGPHRTLCGTAWRARPNSGSVDRHGNISEKLEPSAIGYILRKIQTSLTLPENKKPRQWTGHSFSVGAAVDLVERGYTIEQVMRKGDWKSVRSSLRYLMAE